jgi:hypothetical protein
MSSSFVIHSRPRRLKAVSAASNGAISRGVLLGDAAVTCSHAAGVTEEDAVFHASPWDRICKSVPPGWPAQRNSLA